ncbi:MAG: CcdB family protein [Proteobacteria bacterium]|nr:CcdB family protein [Pseudomonadota bacterium]
MQFDLYRLPHRPDTLVVDIQSGLLDDLRTRVVIPLVQRDQAPKTLLDTLNPCLRIDDRDYVLMPQMIASIPKSELTQAAGSAVDYRDTIVRAIDTIVSGL